MWVNNFAEEMLNMAFGSGCRSGRNSFYMAKRRVSEGKTDLSSMQRTRSKMEKAGVRNGKTNCP